MTRIFRTSVAIAALISLGGCGIFKSAPKKTPTVGQRVPILVSENGVETDKTIADIQVLLPAPAANDSWAQPGGNAAKAMGQLALAASPTRIWTAAIDGGFEPRAARRGAGRRRRQAVRDRCRRERPCLHLRHRRAVVDGVAVRFEGKPRRALRRRRQL